MVGPLAETQLGLAPFLAGPTGPGVMREVEETNRASGPFTRS